MSIAFLAAALSTSFIEYEVAVLPHRFYLANNGGTVLLDRYDSVLGQHFYYRYTGGQATPVTFGPQGDYKGWLDESGRLFGITSGNEGVRWNATLRAAGQYNRQVLGKLNDGSLFRTIGELPTGQFYGETVSQFNTTQAVLVNPDRTYKFIGFPGSGSV